MFPLPPLAPKECDGGTITQVQVDAWLSSGSDPATVSVPVRGGAWLGGTVNGTCPGPAPDGVATAIQPALLEAVHGQFAAVAIEAAPPPPAPAMSCVAGVTLYVQPLACVTGTVWPAIESDPSRAGPELAAAANCTCPLPLPLAPAAIVSHGAPLEADHAHPGSLVTWMVPLPAGEPTLTLGGLTPNVQPVACVTVTVWSAIRSDPVRAAAGFAATLNRTSPGPLPDWPAVTVIQSSALAADHAHPWLPDTWTVPVPAVAPTLTLAGFTPRAQPDAWVTVTVWSAMRTDPVRPWVAFAATATRTSPGPLPD